MDTLETSRRRFAAFHVLLMELCDVDTSSSFVEAVTEARCARVMYGTPRVVILLVRAIREFDFARYATLWSLQGARLAGVEHHLIVGALVDVLHDVNFATTRPVISSGPVPRKARSE